MTIRLLVSLVLVALPTMAFGADRVRLVEGGSVSGEIQRTLRAGVTIVDDGKSKNIPIDQIETILFDDEPALLTQARINAQNSGYRSALEKLAEVDVTELSGEYVQQDYRYYLAFCKARLAIEGQGDPGGAYKALSSFVKEFDQTFHYFEALETLGELLAMVGRADRAEKMYAAVAAGPTSQLRVRGRLRAAELSMASDDPAAARKRYDSALAEARRAKQIDAKLLEEVQLGRAVSIAAGGQVNEAQKAIAGVLRQLDESESDRLAAAYNALGRCYDVAGDERGALYAYLHTDLLFNGDPSNHAEALARLGVLWRSAGKPAEAADARSRLTRRYGATRWAQQAD